MGEEPENGGDGVQRCGHHESDIEAGKVVGDETARCEDFETSFDDGAACEMVVAGVVCFECFGEFGASAGSCRCGDRREDVEKEKGDLAFEISVLC